MKKVLEKQLGILKDPNSIPFEYSFNFIKNIDTFKVFELEFEDVFIHILFPSDYPFSAPSIVFLNLHVAAKHDLLENKIVNLCGYCPAIDIRQIIINCYMIFSEILADERNDELVELLQLVFPICESKNEESETNEIRHAFQKAILNTNNKI